MTLPEGVTPQDGVVLITHGTLAHNQMETIVTLRDALAERGIASLAINLSFGISDRTGFYDCAAGVNEHKHEDALDEIGAWLDWLKGQGVGRVALMGHSRGGNQTAWYAAERADQTVKAVVLLAPATSDHDTAAESYKRRYGRDLPELLERAHGMSPDEVLEDVPFLQCESANVSAGSFLSYYGKESRRDTPSLLPKIEQPVLVIAGSADRVVTGLTERVVPMQSEDLKFVEVVGAGHFFLELFMEDVADAVDAFLEESW
jgi:pimeloyl-ACP methyl ester carboxylesterase